MDIALDEIEVVTLFVSDLQTTRDFYLRVFETKIAYQDEVSCVMKFGGVMINLLDRTEAPGLVAPERIAAPGAGPSALFTIRVKDADAAFDQLRSKGVVLLNGPADRPWGRRTAAFSDPAGNIWEVAQEL